MKKIPTLESTIASRYGVDAMQATPGTIIWAADHLATLRGYAVARTELDRLNRRRMKAGKSPAFPEYRTALWLAGLAPTPQRDREWNPPIFWA